MTRRKGENMGATLWYILIAGIEFILAVLAFAAKKKTLGIIFLCLLLLTLVIPIHFWVASPM